MTRLTYPLRDKPGLTAVVVGIAVAAFGAGAMAAVSPALALAALAALALLVAAAKWPQSLPPFLILAAFPLSRPNLLGEQWSAAALVLVAAAALITAFSPGRHLAVGMPWARPLRSVYVWLAAGYVWLVARAVAGFGQHSAVVALQGGIITVGTVAGAALVLADERYRLTVARGFVGLVALLCASYTITAAIWFVAGTAAPYLTTLPIPGLAGTVGVHAPFTTTASQLTLFGVTLPRFVGVGREPGWMAMYAASAFFLAPRIGWSRWWVRAVLAVGLLGCLSTGAFAMFVVLLAYELFVRPRSSGPALLAYLRQLTGLGVLVAAAWIAFNAPGLGVNSKASVNARSLAERDAATDAGWHALLHSPFAGEASRLVGGVNLIAAIAAVGLPFVVAIIAALLAPRLSHPAISLTTAPVLVVLLTLLSSQPPGDSTWAYVCVIVAYAVPLRPFDPSTGLITHHNPRHHPPDRRDPLLAS